MLGILVVDKIRLVPRDPDYVVMKAGRLLWSISSEDTVSGLRVSIEHKSIGQDTNRYVPMAYKSNCSTGPRLFWCLCRCGLNIQILEVYCTLCVA